MVDSRVPCTPARAGGAARGWCGAGPYTRFAEHLTAPMSTSLAQGVAVLDADLENLRVKKA